MKKYFYIPLLSFLLILLSFSFSSCSKNEDSNQANLSWTVDGNSYNGGPNVYARRITASPTTKIEGASDAESIIGISLMNCDTIGVYVAKMLGATPNSAYFYLQQGNTEYDSDYNLADEALVINVTRLNATSIGGNFSGSLRSAGGIKINIQGNFEVPFH